MAAGKRQLAVRAMRGQMWSPGRPSTARREDRVRFWEAIARGAASEDAAVATGASQAVGSRWFRQAGGMPPISLVPLSGRYLSFSEREEIAILHAQCHGVREIARRVGRSASTISRELRRNAATRSHTVVYRATTAQWHAERRASRPKVSKLAACDALREYVRDRLAGVIARPNGELVPGPDARWVGRRHGRRQDRRWARSWSPEQISNRVRIDFPDDLSMRISHEAIYQALYVQGRGALKRELVACLRTGRALRVPRARTRGGKQFVTPAVMLSERPAEAPRAPPAHAMRADPARPIVRLGLAHPIAKRLRIDPQITRHRSDRTTALERQAHSSADQLIGILLRTGHNDCFLSRGPKSSFRSLRQTQPASSVSRCWPWSRPSGCCSRLEWVVLVGRPERMGLLVRSGPLERRRVRTLARRCGASRRARFRAGRCSSAVAWFGHPAGASFCSRRRYVAVRPECPGCCYRHF